VIRPYDAVEGLTQRVIRCAIEVHRELGPSPSWPSRSSQATEGEHPWHL